MTLALGGCTAPTGPEASGSTSLSPDSPQEPVQLWWEEVDWSAPSSAYTGEGLALELYTGGRLRIRYDDPMLTQTEGSDCLWRFTFLTREGESVVVTNSSRLALDIDSTDTNRLLGLYGWDDADPAGDHPYTQVHAAVEEDEVLTLQMGEMPWKGELFGVWAKAEREGVNQSLDTFFRVEGDTLVPEESSLPELGETSPQFRYLLLDTGEDRVMLSLYRDGVFLLSMRSAITNKTDLLWGTWDDGNTAITLWPDEQCCGPEGEFRLDKTGGLRVYNGGGPASLPLAKGDAFQKIGDILDLPLFDAAVVSKVVDGDRPALFLSREKDGELLDAFREMMLDAAELKQPRWTEDPEDRPNLQFDLNINGEDITMVLCPCIVEGTEDKYLLVQKDSWMGRVTYTYYQTQGGDDYDRMVELFEQQYEKDPRVFTAAMAAQTRALTAAISNLDWSDQFPLDANGIPVTYKAVLREQKATGYASLRGGQTWGAGSRTCQAKTGIYYCTAGTVAVRANEIPYGTKLYIRTPGGGFIYGYAVANDTGTGLVEGIIDVDLFYDTYEQSVLNSVRWVDIYILE